MAQGEVGRTRVGGQAQHVTALWLGKSEDGSGAV